MKRPGWDEYFLKMAELVAERSTCLRRKVGAVIVNKKRVIATGYNGNCIPAGEHCIEKGYCERDKLGIASGTRYEIGDCTHGEMSAILQCAKFGIPTEGATLYTNYLVCSICAKMIISAGIKRVVCKMDATRPQDGIELLKKADIEVICV
jgi:dCMP deaminase